MQGMRRKINTFFEFDRRMKWLCMQTFFLSGVVRLATLMIPFSKLQCYIGEHNKESIAVIERSQYREVARVSWMVQMVSLYTPWQSKCLVQAIVAQHLLKKRRIPTTLYLGVFKQEGQLKAHAWLRCGKLIVTGAGAKQLCTEVSKFCNEEKIRKMS